MTLNGHPVFACTQVIFWGQIVPSPASRTNSTHTVPTSHLFSFPPVATSFLFHLIVVWAHCTLVGIGYHFSKTLVWCFFSIHTTHSHAATANTTTTLFPSKQITMCGLGSSPSPAFIGSIERLANLLTWSLQRLSSFAHGSSARAHRAASPIPPLICFCLTPLTRMTSVDMVCFFCSRVFLLWCAPLHWARVLFSSCLYRASSPTKTPVNGSFASDLHTEF